jgi:uncharacterized membrane protein YraQ (UPF0718 family)
MFDWIFSRGFIYGIIAVVVAVAIGLFIKHYDDTIKAAALAEYNLRQAQQTIADQNRFIEEMQKLNKDKEKIVSDLIKQRESVEQSLRDIEERIRKNPKASDREASDLLKETIKELEGVVP